MHLVQLLEVGAWTVKPLKDTFASRKFILNIWWDCFSSICELSSAQLWAETNSACRGSRWTPAAALCCAFLESGAAATSLLCSGRCFPTGTEGAWLSHRMWREISAVAASCQLQFHMSVFLLTFSDSTKDIWLTTETTHLFLAAKTRPWVTYCKALFPPDSDLYWSLLKSCVQFFHNCPHSGYGRQPIKH